MTIKELSIIREHLNGLSKHSKVVIERADKNGIRFYQNGTLMLAQLKRNKIIISKTI